jgi:hypothetical protein
MLRYLLQHGANPLIRDVWGNRPIDDLEHARFTDITPILAALKRDLT